MKSETLQLFWFVFFLFLFFLFPPGQSSLEGHVQLEAEGGWGRERVERTFLLCYSILLKGVKDKADLLSLCPLMFQSIYIQSNTFPNLCTSGLALLVPHGEVLLLHKHTRTDAPSLGTFQVRLDRLLST